ncbi:unnamed protein product, partial [Adineta ricciae]
MSKTVVPSLLTIPIEIVYRILDQMTPKNIMKSLREVCQRLNKIIDTYPPYKKFDRVFLKAGEMDPERFAPLANALKFNK